MLHPILKPTAYQTFEIVGEGDWDFSRILARSRRLQEEGRVEEACNERFHATQRLAELLPEGEEVILEWNHAPSRAALELLHASAVDHFLIDDFELSAALLEQLLELDPEDHLESVILLSFDYLALGEYEAFDEVVNDISDKYPCRELLLLWASYRQQGRLDEGELMRLKSRHRPYFDEFTADEHPADEAYLKDIESQRPSAAAQARELWLQTENLWRLHPHFIEALRAARR